MRDTTTTMRSKVLLLLTDATIVEFFSCGASLCVRVILGIEQVSGGAARLSMEYTLVTTADCSSFSFQIDGKRHLTL